MNAPIGPAGVPSPFQAAPPGATPGATYTPVYVNRTSKAYCIHEHEIEAITTMNSLSTVFFSGASGLLTFAAGAGANAAFYDGKSMPPAAELMLKFIIPACILGSAILAILGFWARWRRASTWEIIRQESGVAAIGWRAKWRNALNALRGKS